MKWAGSIGVPCKIGACLLLLCFSLACEDQIRPGAIELVGKEDMGQADMFEPDPIVPTIECRGKVDGQACFIQNGTGACVLGVCQRVACEFGWGACNDDPVDGCEEDLSSPTNCGACSKVCEADETCQHGRFGYGCGVGVLCESGQFDLDFDLSNGCEWRAEWGASSAIPFEIAEVEEVYAQDGGVFAMGVGDGSRWVVTPAGSSEVGPAPMESSSVGLFVMCEDESCHTRAVWDDQLVDIHEDATTQELSFDCTIPREIRASSGDFVVTQNEVFGMRSTGSELEAFGRVGRAEYLKLVEASSTPFGAEELAMCDACATTADAECIGPTCIPAAFDTQICTCSSVGCPDFRPQALVHVGSTGALLILTARGLLLLDANDLTLRARVESPFVPGVAQGAPFGALASDGSTALLLSGDRWVAYQVAADTLTNKGAPVGLATAALEQAALHQEAILLRTSNQLFLTRPDLGARTIDISADEIPGGAEFRILSLQGADDGFVIIYESFGSLILRQVRREVE